MNPSPQARATVLIADDHAIVAEGLAGSLNPYFTIVAQVTSLDTLISTIRSSRPDVVVLDLTFHGESSLPVMRAALEQKRIKCKFVVLTGYESAALERASFEAGAAAFILKAAGTQDLRLAIEAALAGKRFIPETLRVQNPALHARRRRRGFTVAGVSLKPRQAEVLLLLYQGRSRRSVGEELELTSKGVDFHASSAKDAVGISNLPLLMRWVGEHAEELRAGLVEAADEEAALNRDNT